MATTEESFKKALDTLGKPVNTAQLNTTQFRTDLNPNNIQPASFASQQRAQLQDAQRLSELYGNIDYDRNSIEGIFQDATDAEFAAKRAAYGRTANKYYDNLGQNQNTYLDAMRKARAGSIQSGVNAGMQNASELSALLGMSQQSAADATQLAQDERALEDKYAEARAGNVQKAMEYANTQKLALGTLGSNIYSADTQQYAAELGHNATVSAANQAAQAQAYASDRSLQGTIYNSDQNLAGQKYASDSAYNSSTYNTQGNLYGNMYSSDNTLAGNKYTADKIYGNKSSGGGGGGSRSSGSSGGVSATDFQAAMQQSINDTSIKVALINAGDATTKKNESNRINPFSSTTTTKPKSSSSGAGKSMYGY